MTKLIFTTNIVQNLSYEIMKEIYKLDPVRIQLFSGNFSRMYENVYHFKKKLKNIIVFLKGHKVEYVVLNFDYPLMIKVSDLHHSRAAFIGFWYQSIFKCSASDNTYHTNFV